MGIGCFSIIVFDRWPGTDVFRPVVGLHWKPSDFLSGKKPLFNVTSCRTRHLQKRGSSGLYVSFCPVVRARPPTRFLSPSSTLTSSACPYVGLAKTAWTLGAGNGAAGATGEREGLVDQAGNLLLGDRPADGQGAKQQGTGTSTNGATSESRLE